jgi:23S rRNA (cytidine1920-2'-O)/16S rRNA (cytidine1409-2'-O)-methyltransferase
MSRSMRRRADLTLVELGRFPSRARAQAAIAAGLVRIDGATLRKASDLIDAEASIETSAPHPWVSRGGVKLAAALNAFGFDPGGLNAVDVGASTGGFTDVLLARGALHVDAVDVGHGQLDGRLRNDPRVASHEGLDARAVTPAHLEQSPRAIVCDVSFISLRLVLPHVLSLASRDAWLIALIKPQFEAGRVRAKKGIVADPAALDEACASVSACVAGLGWSIAGVIPSPIAGGDGQREFLIGARNG